MIKMGTNYYWYDKPDCPCCGRSFDSLHIGKSSGGWCFSLHVIPELGINSLDDWRARFSIEGSHIKDECGYAVSLDEMLSIITEREGRIDDWGKFACFGYKSEADFHARNFSERGPNGLMRHRLNYRCVSQGGGTWDCIVGEFS